MLPYNRSIYAFIISFLLLCAETTYGACTTLCDASKLEMTVQISTEVDISSGGIENFWTSITKSLCRDFLWSGVRYETDANKTRRT